MQKKVIAVQINPKHTFSKTACKSVKLIAGLGIEGDAHFGKTVQHIYAQRKVPQTPNLRQVHLIQVELFAELQQKGFSVVPGALGENITTQGVDLLSLPLGTKIQLGEDALIELTGLRTPCNQINELQAGLMAALFDHDDNGELIRKAGVMAIILKEGTVKAGDEIQIFLPEKPHQPLPPV